MAEAELSALEMRAIAGRLATRLLGQGLKELAAALGRNDREQALSLLAGLKERTEETFASVEGLPGAERADVQAVQSIAFELVRDMIEDAAMHIGRETPPEQAAGRV